MIWVTLKVVLIIYLVSFLISCLTGSWLHAMSGGHD